MGEESLLGWQVRKEKAPYRINLPQLSAEEEQLILDVEEKFKEVSKREELNEKGEIKEKISTLIEEYCSENSIALDEEQSRYLNEIAFLHIYGFCALEPLLADDKIEEIAAIGLNKPVYVYVRNKGWQKTNAYFTKQEVLINLINKMARTLGRRITYHSPRLNAILPDGSRLHASIPPVSQFELTIRKFRENPFTIPELLSLKTFTPESLAVLWLFMQSDLSIIIAGNTASGKTTTLNALFSFVPLSERILITEETPEINIPHAHSLRLLSNYELGISMQELVWDALRMRPDRVIVGEVRTGEEVNALIETILSGQARGSYATFHAQSAKEALYRMRSLGALEIDLQSIDLILVQRRMLKYNPHTRKSSEIRRVTEISEIEKEGQLSAKPIFIYDYKKDSLLPNYKNSKLLSAIGKNFGMSKKELNAEIRKRARFLSSLVGKKISFSDSVSRIQKFTYA